MTARSIVFPGPLTYPGANVYPASAVGVIPGTAQIAAIPEPNMSPPQVLLNLSNVTSTSGTPVTKVRVYRTNPDGTTQTVRTGMTGDWINLVGGAATVIDVEAPYNAVISYSVEKSATVTTGNLILSATQPWLVNPLYPDLSVPLTVTSMSERTYSSSSVAWPILGSALPTVISDGARKAAQFTLTLKTATDDDEDALFSLLQDQATLLLQIVQPTYTNRTLYEWVTVGDLTVTPYSLTNWDDQRRTWSMACSRAHRPVGTVLSQWQISDVAAAYQSIAALAAAFQTNRGLLINLPGT